MSDITAAEDATRIAEQLLNKYYSFYRLEMAKKIDGSWLVEYDVSILGPKQMITIKLDAKTGSILEYVKK